MSVHPPSLIRRLTATGSALALAAVGLVATGPIAQAAGPGDVVLVGSLQDELGCDADWMPACDATKLAPTAAAGIYASTFEVPAGDYEVKAALNGTWDESHGIGGGEENIPLRLAGQTSVRFTYDAATTRVSIALPGQPQEYTDADAPLAAAPSRHPGAGQNFYFVLTDRFADGDPSNNAGGIAGDRMATGYDPADKGFYQGGDIAGIRENLDYIEGLGTTAIWLTPSFTNRPVQGTGADASAGYHGYWVTDFTMIDPHLGTNEELSALIDEAHSRGIKVYFDIITNHTADLVDYEEGEYSYIDQATSPYTDAAGKPVDVTALSGSPDFPALDPATSFPRTPVRAPENAVMVPGELNDVTMYHNRGNSTWQGESVTFGDFDGLDDLMTEDPRVQETMDRIYETWMDFGIDGYRIDTVKHVNFQFWEQFTERMDARRATAPAGEEFFMFGEVYDADATLLSPYVRDTEMDGVLDFAFQSSALNYAKGYGAQGLQGLFAADDRYTTPGSSASDLPTFLGNHDMGRIGYLLKDSDHRPERVRLANASMFLTRGQPVTYYGDEQGFAGDGADKDARQSMFASQVPSYLDDALVDGAPYGTGEHFGTDGALYQDISTLATLRSQTPALSTGAQIELHSDTGAGIYAFARVDRTEKVEHLVALNNATSEKTVTLTTLTPGATYAPLYGTQSGVTADASGSATLTVPALSAIALKADRPVADTGADQHVALDLPDGAKLEGTAPISASLVRGRLAETSFSYRLAGESDWTPLGTAEDDTPRVYHDVSGLPAGTVVEYRAVSTDADGSRVADSGVGVVGVDLADAEAAGPGGDTVGPDDVTVPGSHNAAMGCAADWKPDCADARLEKDPASGLYTATFDLPAGTYEYKVAVGGSWDVNYGAGGVPGGPNVTYTHGGGPVTFWYDPATHYVSNTSAAPVMTLPGSFDAALGCAGDWAPDCMATWLQDPDGDGVFTFSTTKIPAGAHEMKVAHNRSWAENYGQDGAKDGANYTFSTQAGKLVTFRYTLSTHKLEIEVEDPPLAGTGQQLGHFVDPATIAWPADRAAAGSTWELWSSPTGGLALEGGEVTGGTRLGTLERSAAGLTDAQLENRRHLRGFAALTLSGVDDATLKDALTGQLLVLQRDADGTPQVLTGLQIPGVLDALYAASAREGQDIGLRFDGGVPTLTLWAPSAKSVSLQLFDDAGAGPVAMPMTREDDGTWTITGDPTWADRQYLFDVEVYVPALDAVVHNEVTDPYSLGLTLDSQRSVILDLSDPRWAPEIWTGTPAPAVAQFADQTIYEMHVRDFSAGDRTVPEAQRGTYAAFAADSDGTTRLRELADAGITTVHLLPTFDIATIEEDRTKQKVPAIPADAGPASEEQQAAVAAVADQDAYNWGYDPFHYMAPEGSYATDGHQEGGERTAEFRTMVGSLHEMGLQVVLDQVYNHTASAGQADTSVLDKVVPGYYQRLSLTGTVETSTCCSNVATEHAMAEQLMVDSTVTWARDYRVDGFRFDLMGHSSRANMEAVRAALDELTLEADGVDGASIYLYGEGWDFGEVAGGARFDQATQGGLDGTSIGAFNDRLRDGVHGGSPFDVDKRTHQGFGNGLSTDPNANAQGTPEEQLADLRHRTDLVRIGLAGNLRDYSFTASDGRTVTGAGLDYNGAPAGFATRPEESVNYVDAHDNESLYDMNVWKLPRGTSPEDRVRMNTLSLATTALGQSPSFWAGGTDLLRSKSLDRDSYNSGDHFNAIDWTRTDNGFGRGLPPAGKNAEAWPLMRPMLEDPTLHPGAAAIDASAEQTLDLLRLRSSSNLFTLGDPELIAQKVTFPNAGPDATPGLLVMRIDDTVGADADPALDGIVTVFNASGAPISEAIDGMAGEGYVLSQIQADGADAVVKTSTWDAATGTATVPVRTVAVFVKAQGAGPVDPEEPCFTDVTPGVQFYDEIQWACHEGIAQGWPDGTFRPLESVNRDAMAAYLYRMAGSPAVTPPRTQPFTDVTPQTEHYDAIIWAYQQGITKGWPDGTFRPTQPIARDAMAAFLYRYAGEPAAPAPTTAPFTDVPADSQFAREIAWMKSEGITEGWPDGTYRPLASTHRDAMAAFLYRLRVDQGITYLSLKGH